MSSGPSESRGSRTILWCVPRSASTALMKCLSFIEDCEVWSEPYLYCYGARIDYRRATNADMPLEYEGNEEVFQRAVEALGDVLRTPFEVDRIVYGNVKSRLEYTISKHVFVKDMALGIGEDTHKFLPRGFNHTFLIRDPLRVIYSYRKMVYTIQKSAGLLPSQLRNEQEFDIDRDDQFFTYGCYYKELHDLWVYIKEKFDIKPVVIEGDDLLTKPKETLSAYCSAVGLPYNDSLLRWDASTDIIGEISAAGNTLLIDNPFFGKAIRSSEFLPPSELPSRDQMTPDVIRCSERVMKYYEEMYEQRLKV